MDYSELPELAAVYLEDSYVMAINTGPDTLTFKLEVVLTENHPQYQPPGPDENHCYANGSLVFRNVSNLEWISKNFHTYTDAAGEEDMGNIDYLKKENDHWRAIGDWGEVLIAADTPPALILDA